MNKEAELNCRKRNRMRIFAVRMIGVLTAGGKNLKKLQESES